MVYGSTIDLIAINFWKHFFETDILCFLFIPELITLSYLFTVIAHYLVLTIIVNY